ncbi:hypothetical protein NQZ68_008516 [Dissostichus eleginoides]|nr:hypothetical protein NQZ68_008516 [Dissostichus eleginoides]
MAVGLVLMRSKIYRKDCDDMVANSLSRDKWAKVSVYQAEGVPYQQNPQQMGLRCLEETKSPLFSSC